MLPARYYLRGEVSVLQLFGIFVYTPLGHKLDRSRKLRLGWFFTENLAGLQKADQLIAQAHRHGGITHSHRTRNRVWFLGRAFRKRFLHLQTGATRAAFLSQDFAKRIFIALAMMRQLP